jgi:hypothetical protein
MTSWWALTKEVQQSGPADAPLCVSTLYGIVITANFIFEPLLVSDKATPASAAKPRPSPSGADADHRALRPRHKPAWFYSAPPVVFNRCACPGDLIPRMWRFTDEP